MSFLLRGKNWHYFVVCDLLLMAFDAPGSNVKFFENISKKNFLKFSIEIGTVWCCVKYFRKKYCIDLSGTRPRTSIFMFWADGPTRFLSYTDKLWLREHNVFEFLINSFCCDLIDFSHFAFISIGSYIKNYEICKKKLICILQCPSNFCRSSTKMYRKYLRMFSFVNLHDMK